MSQLPTPAAAAAEPHPRSSAYTAQLLGEGGARRGIRAGPQAVEAAQGVYRGVEFSGPGDRRLPPGRIASATA